MVSDGVEATGSTARSDPIVQRGHERPGKFTVPLGQLLWQLS